MVILLHRNNICQATASLSQSHLGSSSDSRLNPLYSLGVDPSYAIKNFTEGTLLFPFNSSDTLVLIIAFLLFARVVKKKYEKTQS